MGKCNCGKRCIPCDIKRAYEALSKKRANERRAKPASAPIEEAVPETVIEEIPVVITEEAASAVIEEAPIKRGCSKKRTTMVVVEPSEPQPEPVSVEETPSEEVISETVVLDAHTSEATEEPEIGF